MKFLYFTDSHIRGTNPKSRTDSFFDTVKTKLEEVRSLTQRHQIDYVLHGGDLFDRPDTSLSVIHEIAPLLQSIPAPILAISGNHDIYGHNPITLPRTVMGLLDALGIVTVINGKTMLLQKDDTVVQLTGAPYIYGIDREEHRNLYFVKEKDPRADFAIHLVHGFLMPKKFPLIAHTRVEEVADTAADLTISGHYHDGFPLMEIGDKKFINPGAMVRISNTLTELKRKPKVLLIDVEKSDCEIREYPLQSALPGEEVLDRKEIEMHKFKRRELAEFKESIERTGNFEHIHFMEVITDIAENEKLDPAVKREALQRIAKVEESRGGL